MKEVPYEYVIVEIIPTHSNPQYGFIAQIQALNIQNNQIVDRLDLRVREDLISNKDLLKIISYDKHLFRYVNNKDDLLEQFITFIGKKTLLIIDNSYTRNYLKNIKNTKESVLDYLGLEMTDDVFDKLILKYQLEPSNHLVDLLYEAIIFKVDEK
jgi:DNA polymerase III alpha subunit (gram-positive type)